MTPTACACASEPLRREATVGRVRVVFYECPECARTRTATEAQAPMPVASATAPRLAPQAPPYTPAQDAQLRRMWEAGYSQGDIARHLGRTRNSVAGRIERLHIRHTAGVTVRALPAEVAVAVLLAPLGVTLADLREANKHSPARAVAKRCAAFLLRSRGWSATRIAAFLGSGRS